MSEDIPFVDSSVFQLMNETLSWARSRQYNALVVGASGVGKSRVIAEMVARSDVEPPMGFHTIATMEVSSALGNAVFELLKDMAELIGAGTLTSLPSQERLLKRHKLRDPSRNNIVDTIIFDEAQNLTLKAARTLLGISEASGLRMIFVGNPEVLKFVNLAQAAIQQISRRLPIQQSILSIQPRDADLMASHFRCEGMDTFERVREIARQRHMDGVVKVLREASDFAALDRSKVIRLRHVDQALTMFPIANLAALPKPTRRAVPLAAAVNPVLS